MKGKEKRTAKSIEFNEIVIAFAASPLLTSLWVGRTSKKSVEGTPNKIVENELAKTNEIEEEIIKAARFSLLVTSKNGRRKLICMPGIKPINKPIMTPISIYSIIFFSCFLALIF